MVADRVTLEEASACLRALGAAGLRPGNIKAIAEAPDLAQKFVETLHALPVFAQHQAPETTYDCPDGITRTHQQLYEWQLADCKLIRGTATTLGKRYIFTVGEVMEFSADELSGLRLVGSGMVDSIEQHLASTGLSLSTHGWDQPERFNLGYRSVLLAELERVPIMQISVSSNSFPGAWGFRSMMNGWTVADLERHADGLVAAAVAVRCDDVSENWPGRRSEDESYEAQLAYIRAGISRLAEGLEQIGGFIARIRAFRVRLASL